MEEKSHHQQRLSFLYAAAHSTFSIDPSISRYYLAHLQNYARFEVAEISQLSSTAASNKYKDGIELSDRISRRICKKCSSLLVPGLTSSVSIRKSKKLQAERNVLPQATNQPDSDTQMKDAVNASKESKAIERNRTKRQKLKARKKYREEKAKTKSAVANYLHVKCSFCNYDTVFPGVKNSDITDYDLDKIDSVTVPEPDTKSQGSTDLKSNSDGKFEAVKKKTAQQRKKDLKNKNQLLQISKSKKTDKSVSGFSLKDFLHDI
ncbi:hypothetical protein HK098_004089 [Nowakowskiella sp. JEL0407]|nr:hypothetical protein HK098_004089 [Nowakowskiella sp. JEL0407]